MQNRILTECSCMEWLQIISWTWWNPLLVLFFLHHKVIRNWRFIILPDIFIFFKSQLRWSKVLGPRNSWVWNNSLCCFVRLVTSWSNIALIMILGEVIMSQRFTIWPFHSTPRRSSNYLTWDINIIWAWAKCTSIICESSNFWNKYAVDLSVQYFVLASKIFLIFFIHIKF